MDSPGEQDPKVFCSASYFTIILKTFMMLVFRYFFVAAAVIFTLILYLPFFSPFFIMTFPFLLTLIYFRAFRDTAFRANDFFAFPLTDTRMVKVCFFFFNLLHLMILASVNLFFALVVLMSVNLFFSLPVLLFCSSVSSELPDFSWASYRRIPLSFLHRILPA